MQLLIRGVAIGDLTGDGIPEAAVLILCHPVQGRPKNFVDEVQVFTAAPVGAIRQYANDIVSTPIRSRLLRNGHPPMTSTSWPSFSSRHAIEVLVLCPDGKWVRTTRPC
jgi:hypothetical protein